MKELLNNKKLRVAVLILLTLSVLVLPFLIRAHNSNPLFSGGVFYYHLRATNDLSSNIHWDYLQERPHTISFFHYFLAFTETYFGLNGMLVLSIFFGLISILLFYNIVKSLSEDDDLVILSSLLLVLSPTFLYLFIRFNPQSLAILFSLASVFYLLRNSYLSALFLILTSITDPAIFFMSLLVVLFYCLYRKKRLIFWVNLIASSVTFFIFTYAHPGYLDLGALIQEPSLVSFLTSFGAEVGIAFFYLFLGVIGLFIMWKRKRVYAYVSVLLLITLLVAAFNTAGRIYLNFYLAVLSSAMILFLIRRRWAIETIEKFTLLLIFCGILFSSSLYIDQIIDSHPTSQFAEGLTVIKPIDAGNILTYYGYGHFIQHFSAQSALTDSLSVNSDNYFSLKDVEQTIFYSRNLETTKTAMQENDITHILITPEMKKGLVWNREGEGLLFLLDASPEFEKILSNNELEVWKLLP